MKHLVNLALVISVVSLASTAFAQQPQRIAQKVSNAEADGSWVSTHCVWNSNIPLPE